MDLGLEGKVALVSGGNRGIGHKAFVQGDRSRRRQLWSPHLQARRSCSTKLPREHGMTDRSRIALRGMRDYV